MSPSAFLNLTRRERQIMDVVYSLGRATAADIHAHMPDAISAASLRRLVRILETKGYLDHGRSGREHVYRPVIAPAKARRQAARHMLATLFRGSLPAAVSALLDASQGQLSPEQIAELRRLIDQAESEGR